MFRAALLLGCLTATLLAAQPVAAQDACHVPAEVKPFMDRVFAKMDAVTEKPYGFSAWEQAGRPTQEGFGLLTPGTAIDAEKVVRRVMDVGHYVGNLGHVTASRAVTDARYTPPAAVRFYELINIPIIGDIHFEAVLTDAGTCKGYRVVTWHMLKPETNALSRDVAMRSDYNDGAWFASSTSVGYALSSAPLKDDTNWAQWGALTSGADMTAKGVFEDNLNAMVKWAAKP